MKIEMCGKDIYNIFINREYLKGKDYSVKEDIVKVVKEIIFKLRGRLGLRGFYKIKVFPQKIIGIFLEVIKLDETEFSNSLDLRIITYMDEKFYFETDDYFKIANCNDKRYIDGHFYCVVDDNFDLVLEKVEFGRFIYGKDVNFLLNNSLIL